MLSRAELSFSDEESRFLPLIPIYGSQYKMNELVPPAMKLWAANGQTPVVLVRTGWENGEGFYLGIKGGTASTSHAHMDAGSFVFDALGVRWVQDLGIAGILFAGKGKCRFMEYVAERAALECVPL